MVSGEIIFRVQCSENDAKKHAKEESHGQNDVQLDAGSEWRVNGEGSWAAKAANADIDKLREGECQSERQGHSNEREAEQLRINLIEGKGRNK